MFRKGLIGGLLLLSSCGGISKTEQPKRLSRAEFKEALEMWHYALAARELRMIKGPLESDPEGLQLKVLEQMGVDAARFRETVYWYTAHPGLLKELYQEILSENPIEWAQDSLL
jgi:hypothetical protein